MMNIIPTVHGEYSLSEEIFMVPTDLSVSVTDQTKKSLELFSQRLHKRCNIALHYSDNIDTYINIKNVNDEEKSLGWYSIQVCSKQITVEYIDIEGLNYAFVTLYHLIVNAVLNNMRKLRCCYLSDSPLYNHRGLHVDTARHYFPVEELKKIIEQMSLCKLNVFHWHFADDQGWRIESKAYPLLTRSCKEEFYRHEDVDELVEYAAEREITIVPEIEIPGHARAAISAYPFLSCNGEQIEVATKGGIYPIILCGGKPEVYKWIETILDEMISLFPSKLIHLGGDEAPKQEWEKCPHCKAKMKELKLEDFEDLQGFMINYVKQYLQKHDKNVICWNESLKSKLLSEDIIVQYWAEMQLDSYCISEFKNGHKAIFSEVFSNYFDYPYSMVPLSKTYHYIPSVRGVSFEKSNNTLGIEGAIWTERVETTQQLEYQVFPRAIALAEAAWSGPQEYANFLNRLELYYDELNAAQVNAAPLAQADPSGMERVLEAAQFLQALLSNINSETTTGISPEEVQALIPIFLQGFFNQQESAMLMQFMNMTENKE
ncbi:beta-N-acetylhexosaminidase [Paludicola sp. MB14-C6]|uniref:beta-N-acetylhexosaminidase n=1 Tax=Paludihabitans sp. MB14-C6 TaxID=3070656 RepID=UPI0027DB28F9|nr:beta-N-acetylhexosaminidase [Paludicola sp. MB14-C6]WMJ23518.1 beta-N-acetylhexosaminidase [Paludicola sp. MB14-C6]